MMECPWCAGDMVARLGGESFQCLSCRRVIRQLDLHAGLVPEPPATNRTFQPDSIIEAEMGNDWRHALVGLRESGLW